MKIKFNLCWASPAGSAKPGDVLDLPKGQAEALIGCGAAVPATADDLAPPPPESQSEPAPLPDPETPSAEEGPSTSEDEPAEEPAVEEQPKPAARPGPVLKPRPILPKKG
jgi:hypothetical protein